MKLKIQTWIFLLMLSMAKGALINKNTSLYLIPCEKGWYLFRDKCYNIFGKTQGIAWKSAESSCVAHHGSLVTIQSQELQDFLTTFLILDVKSDVWIGLNDVQEESKFVWSDGSIVNFTHWDFGEPNSRYGGEGEDCGQLRYESEGEIGGWNDKYCGTKWPFLCQKNKSEQSMNHDPRFCTGENEGAWKYQNFCYHTVSEEKSWDDAENYCQTILNGHLLTIIDSEVDLYLKYALSDFSKKFWIGIKIRDAAQQMWSSEWILNLKKWENNNIPKMNGTCAYMTEKRLWSSDSCLRKLPFVCEVLQVKPPPLKQAPDGWKCPELSQDWVDLGGENCYIFETKEQKNWQEANLVCFKKGGHLAIIHSAAEENAIHRRIVGLHHTMLVGLHRSLSDNSVFEWVDGTVLDYLHWNDGEPNNKNEACGEIWTKDMTWNDYFCDKPKEYICSAKKVPSFGNETDWIDSQRSENCSCSVRSIGNETAWRDSQRSENCSGNALWNITLALLLVAAIIFVVGFTIYIYRNQYRKSFQRWKKFATSFSTKSGTASNELVPDDLENIIEQNEIIKIY